MSLSDTETDSELRQVNNSRHRSRLTKPWKSLCEVAIAREMLAPSSRAQSSKRVPLGETGGKGADIRFYAADGSLVLRRELKATGNILDKKTGNILDTTYSAFNDRISEAASQAKQSGEIWLQVNSGTKVDDYLRRFNAAPGRNMDKYKDMTLQVVDEFGNVLYRGPIKQ